MQSIQAQQSDAQKKVSISEQTKTEVLDSLLQKLNEFYIFPDTALKLKRQLDFTKRKAVTQKLKTQKNLAKIPAISN